MSSTSQSSESSPESDIASVDYRSDLQQQGLEQILSEVPEQEVPSDPAYKYKSEKLFAECPHTVYEPRYEKTGSLHMQKQIRRSAVQ